MRLLQSMIENQQMEILHQGLLMVRSDPRPENVTDFRRLQLAVFSGTKSPSNVKQWLTDMTDLLKASRVLNENQVEMTKILNEKM